MASKTPVGFIGLGNMGSPMAKNLLKNGYPIIATDVFPESCKELQDIGAQVTLREYHWWLSGIDYHSIIKTLCSFLKQLLNEYMRGFCRESVYFVLVTITPIFR